MKIFPTAIRQKVFESSFRGYEKKQVTDFLEEMSVAMEQINQENLELRSRLQQVEGEAKRLKDVEDSLFRTLKTAEDTGAAIITEATEAADQIIAEANQIAEQLGNDSSEQARLITQAAEENAKETMRTLSENLKGLIKSYEGLVEQREALVKSLRRLSQDALNQIDLSETHFSRIDAKAYQRTTEELSRSNYFSATNAAALAAASNPSPIQPEEARVEPPQEEAQSVVIEEKVEVESFVSEELIAGDFPTEEENISLHEEESDSVIHEEQENSVEELASEADQDDEVEEEMELADEELAQVENKAFVEESEEENEPEEAAEIQAAAEDMEASENPSAELDDQKKEGEGKSSSGSFFDQFH
ncbi:MAG: DivIVA domain-containing protein [Bacteroidetes bacterium]|nr:DivIVA domain-containing protein [Bacteroidota bacterium]